MMIGSTNILENITRFNFDEKTLYHLKQENREIDLTVL